MTSRRKHPWQVSGLGLWLGWVVCVAGLPVSAALYRWTDGQGAVRYATTLPTVAVEHLEIKQGDAWIPYHPQDTAPPPRDRAVHVPQYDTYAAHAEIPYRKQQNIILVHATLNHLHSANFIIDTGATYSIVSPAVADILGLRPDPSAAVITLRTANGEIQAPLVNIAVIRLGDLLIPNVMAAIHDLEASPDIEGVLGLNLLNRFTMTVDAGRHALILEAIRPLSRYDQQDCAKAHVLLAQGRKPNVQPEREIDLYRQAIALCHDFIEAHIALANVYYLAERYQDAIDQYLAVLRVLPDEPHAHYQLGVLHAIAGQYPQARRAFRQALDLDPHHQDARDALRKLAP